MPRRRRHPHLSYRSRKIRGGLRRLPRKDGKRHPRRAGAAEGGRRAADQAGNVCRAFLGPQLERALGEIMTTAAGHFSPPVPIKRSFDRRRADRPNRRVVFSRAILGASERWTAPHRTCGPPGYFGPRRRKGGEFARWGLGGGEQWGRYEVCGRKIRRHMFVGEALSREEGGVAIRSSRMSPCWAARVYSLSVL